ncbi:winged helix-turn-helix domain-containing protein [Vibrio vulnificus]|nr:hypothetical protein [Vibrio vulnificus]EGR1894632.1 hypothetical protein [Vibrio vulnificus]EIV1854212.1 winged helix-turn-helix domain-containing protein [Vibrio vulnificus]
MMRNILEEAKEIGCLIKIGGMIYDPQKKHLLYNDEPIDLEPRTIELLEFLLTHVGEPLSANAIIQEIWRSDYISKNVLTNRISTFRALLQKYLTNEDATKILVTYPRKGYYLCESQVKLLVHGQEEQQPQPGASPTIRLALSAKIAKMKPVHYLLMLLSMAFFVLSYLYISETSSLIEQYRKQQTIQMRELLLNRVDATGPLSKQHRRVIKALILEQQIEYPYTDLVNQDIPSYFVTTIDDGPYWPGAKESIASEYKLNLRLKDLDTPFTIHAEAKLIFSASDKEVFKKNYIINLNSLSLSLLPLQQDIARFFALPIPIEYDWQLDNLSVFTQYDREIADGSFIPDDEFKALYFARHTTLFESNKGQLEKAISQLYTRFTPLPDELGIWLGLINLKVGSLENAFDFLRTPVGGSRIDNAFIYLLVSDISYKSGREDLFMKNYLQSIVSLSHSVPSKALFERLAQPESVKTCLSPWNQLESEFSNKTMTHAWRNMLEAYCKTMAKVLEKK